MVVSCKIAGFRFSGYIRAYRHYERDTVAPTTIPRHQNSSKALYSMVFGPKSQIPGPAPCRRG